jgi:hypothetical protein
VTPSFLPMMQFRSRSAFAQLEQLSGCRNCSFERCEAVDKIAQNSAALHLQIERFAMFVGQTILHCLKLSAPT